MECPKCGAEIDKNAMVCPNCKKVLKIVCPVCRTVNTKNICKKCGEILVTKCNRCGKINLTKNPKCIKCGYSNEISAVQGESNTDTFALLRIDFPNRDVIKSVLGSNQLFTKFFANLDNLIVNYLNSLHVRRQVVKGGTYIIRFNKDYTFSSSSNSVILATIEILNLITRINVKLLKKKNVALKCNFTIMKRDADKDPYDIDSGFQANMVYQGEKKEMKALEAFQVITDEDFYEIYKEHYKLDSLNSVLVNGVMKRFFEINLKEFVKINEFLQSEAEKEHEDNIEVPNFVQTMLTEQEKITKETLDEENLISDDEIYDIEMINFDEINCVFYKTENVKVLDNVVEVLQDVPKGILAIKGSNMYQPYTLKLLSAVDELGIYNSVIPITCHDDMKYSPYSFFRDLVSSVFEYTVSQKLFDTNDFSMFAKIDSSNLVRDLVTLTQRGMNDFEETRDSYFQVFLSLLQSIPDTLIYIENFEKIDASSMFVLEQLFDHFEELNVSYLISYDKEFSLHRKCHFLLSRPYYTEITLHPTPFENIIESDKEFYKNIMTDFYFQRIAKYACGSTLFLDFAIQYLLESGVYSYTEYSIVMVNPKTIIIPSSLGKLMKRRLNLLKDDIRAIKFLTMSVLLGTRVDIKTLEALGFANWRPIADKLSEMGYLYFYNNCMYFSNYNLLRENILEVIPQDELKNISNDLFNLVFIEDMPSPVKAFLYELSDDKEKVIFEWEKLANINLSMGDFSSYLNCSGEILKCLDKYSERWSAEELESYKMSIYENISNNMFEYDPEQTREIAEKTLTNLQKSSNTQNFVSLCTKMIQGSLLHGDYMYALGLTHKVLSVMDQVSIDPAAQNFDLNFLLMSMIHIKILFNIGAYDDCLDIGYNVLNVLDSQKLETIKYTVIQKNDFKFLLSECVAYIAIVDIISLKEDVTEFLDISNKLFNFLPKEYSIFVQLQNLIKGQKVTLTTNMGGNNLFSRILYHIMRAFVNFKDDPSAFAQEVYKAKLISKEAYMYKFELFTDLLIGYAYIQLGSYTKASAMLYKIVKTAKEKGMNSILHLAWYIISIVNIKQGKFDIAYGVLNNSNIQMEKSGGISEYLTMLNKVNMYKVLMCTQAQDKAQICLNQASYIVQKYGLNFNLNIDIKKIMSENQNINNRAAITQSGAEQPVNNEVRVSEEENTTVVSSSGGFDEDDGDVINPEDFFSDN